MRTVSRAVSSVLAALALILPLTLLDTGSPAQAAAAAPLRVMTWNVLGPSAGLGHPSPVSWDSRRSAVFARIDANAPDILGLQEVSNCRAETCGRDISPGSEIAAHLGSAYSYYPALSTVAGHSPKMIMWRSSRFTAVPGRAGSVSFTGLASTTPGYEPRCEEQVGKPGPYNSRQVTWIELSEPATGKTYFVLNTHMFNNKDGADCWRYRHKAADTIKNVILRQNTARHPVVVTGDFNDRTASCALPSDEAQPRGATMINLSQQTEWLNLELDRPGTECKPTFNVNWNGSTMDDGTARIDYIAHTSDLAFVAQRVDTTPIAGGTRTASDHYPVILRLQP